jgi:hypothetical protein
MVVTLLLTFSSFDASITGKGKIDVYLATISLELPSHRKKRNHPKENTTRSGIVN